jgi:hypothetical protein
LECRVWVSIRVLEFRVSEPYRVSDSQSPRQETTAVADAKPDETTAGADAKPELSTADEMRRLGWSAEETID